LFNNDLFNQHFLNNRITDASYTEPDSTNSTAGPMFRALINHTSARQAAMKLNASHKYMI
jgi:hypothetical protein